MLAYRLLRELNPRYDLERQNFYDENWQSILREPKILSLNLAKSVIRGGLAGALIGTSIGSLSSLFGGDLANCCEIGASGGTLFGAVCDAVQYSARFCYQTIKRDIACLRQESTGK